MADIMSQNLIALDLDGQMCLHGGGQLEEWFFTTPGPILETLRVPSANQHIDALLAGRHAVQPSPLFRLPVELLDAIFAEIAASAGAYDARLLLLALACKALLACARRHVVRDQTRRRAPLAGHRLVCVQLGDTARGVITSAEEERLRGAANLKEGSDEGCVSLYEHAVARWRRYMPPPSSCGSKMHGKSPALRPMGLAGLADLLYRPSAVSRMSTEDFARFQTLTAPSDTFDEDRAVLCNFSKGEYVHAATSRGELAVAIGGGSFSLWHMLLACICWIPAGQRSEVEGMGRWAGDRFMVTTLNDLNSREEGREWKDVTAEVTMTVKALQAVFVDADDVVEHN